MSLLEEPNLSSCLLLQIEAAMQEDQNSNPLCREETPNQPQAQKSGKEASLSNLRKRNGKQHTSLQKLKQNHDSLDLATLAKQQAGKDKQELQPPQHIVTRPSSNKEQSYYKDQKSPERFEPIDMMYDNYQTEPQVVSQTSKLHQPNAVESGMSNEQQEQDNDPNKGLITVNSFVGKKSRCNASKSVRVTSKKAALAHQDDHVPAADRDCVAPDLESAKQALNKRLHSLEQLASGQSIDLRSAKEGVQGKREQGKEISSKGNQSLSSLQESNDDYQKDQVAEKGTVNFTRKEGTILHGNEDGDYNEPFAEYESSYNAVYLPQPCASIHKITDEELQEEQAKDKAYERAIHRAALRTEMDEETLRKNPMLLSLLNNTDASRRILPAGHQPSLHPKKDLIENVKHGNSIFPFACYVWVPQNYSYRVALHWHPEVELVRFNRGLFKISIDMQDTIIEDNAFMLLPGNIMHTFTMPPNCEESALVFDPHMLFLQNYDEVQSEILEALVSGNMPLPPIITPEHKCFAKIDSLYSYCVEHGATTNASHRLMIKAKLLEILAIYHEHGLISRKEVHSNLKRSKQDKLKELLNYIDSHYAGPITIKDASNRLGVTDQYFCRFFKRVTGMSFTEYLNDLRLRRAAKEIELSNRSISDIAYEHGFENVGYFFKTFKNKFSLTPLKYRKQHLATLNRDPNL